MEKWRGKQPILILSAIAATMLLAGCTVTPPAGLKLPGTSPKPSGGNLQLNSFKVPVRLYGANYPVFTSQQPVGKNNCNELYCLVYPNASYYLTCTNTTCQWNMKDPSASPPPDSFGVIFQPAPTDKPYMLACSDKNSYQSCIWVPKQ